MVAVAAAITLLRSSAAATRVIGVASVAARPGRAYTPAALSAVRRLRRLSLLVIRPLPVFDLEHIAFVHAQHDIDPDALAISNRTAAHRHRRAVVRFALSGADIVVVV